MNKLASLLLLLPLISCVSATVTEPSVCDSDSLSFSLSSLPPIPPGFDAGAYSGLTYTLPAYSQSTSFDFSKTLSKIADVDSNITVGFTTLTLDNPNGQFDWVQLLQVTMQSDTLPIIPLATLQSVTGGTEINLLPSLQTTAATILTYFQSGKVTLTVTLGPTVVDEQTVQLLESLNGQISTNVNVCLSASTQVTKSL
jgi:hypothetical protein